MYKTVIVLLLVPVLAFSQKLVKIDNATELENTAFEPEIPDTIPETPPPKKIELDILRQRVDPEGLLR